MPLIPGQKFHVLHGVVAQHAAAQAAAVGCETSVSPLMFGPLMYDELKAHANGVKDGDGDTDGDADGDGEFEAKAVDEAVTWASATGKIQNKESTSVTSNDGRICKGIFIQRN